MRALPVSSAAADISPATDAPGVDGWSSCFDLGRPQPLFEAALAAAYGTAIVNVAALRQHEVDGDWGHAWAQTNSEGIGTGPYRVASFDIETGVVLEQYPGYWRGWEERAFRSSHHSCRRRAGDAAVADRERSRRTSPPRYRWPPCKIWPRTRT